MTLRRFKPENSCAVVHDEVVPSLGRLSHCAAAVRLILFLGLMLAMVIVRLVYRRTPPEKWFSIAQIFYRTLLLIIGFRVRMQGEISPAKPTLFVSNHISYLDIPVLGALIPASFVAKSEVAGWPLFGFMAKLQETVFVQRKTTRAAEQSAYLHNLLAGGRNLILFPEGTSSDGQTVLPFKSSLFSVAEYASADVPLTVQPVTIACTGMNGLPMTRLTRPFYAWYGDMILVPHLWTVFRVGHFTLDVLFHPPVAARDFPNRKALAAWCQQQVARGLEQCITGRPGLHDVPAAPKRLTAAMQTE